MNIQRTVQNHQQKVRKHESTKQKYSWTDDHEGLSIQAKALSMPDDPCDKIAFGMLSMLNREDVGQMMWTNGLGKKYVTYQIKNKWPNIT